MSRNNKKKSGGIQAAFKAMSATQKKACTILAICAGALLATIIVCAVLLHIWGNKAPQDVDTSGADDVITEEYDPQAYALDTGNSAVLASTEDQGNDYLKDTVFVGDSNTVRMYSYGLVSLNQFVGKVGLGIQTLTSDKCVYFKNDTTAYAIPEALAKMKPRRIIVMMGTNNVDGAMDSSTFISDYRSALEAIKSAYSYTDIIVAAIPPVPANHSSYPNIKMQLIDEFNQALLQMCQDDGYKFLNTSEVLKDSNGFGVSGYFTSGDIHFTKQGINALLDYVKTHAFVSDDRRPDTANIPARADTPKSNTTTSMNAGNSGFTATYETETGGTLSCDSTVGEKSLKYTVGSDSSITVVAVPEEGYEFYKWSDGSTTATRTDKDFTQSISVTAMFNKINKLAITLSTTSVNMTAGTDNSITATVENGDAAKVVWTGAAGYTGATYNLKNLTAGEYTLTATITANNVTKTAQAKVVVTNAEPGISLSTSSVTMTVGEDKSITATVTNADAAKVVWSGAASYTGATYSLKNLSAGNYTLTATITANNVTKTAQATVVVNKPAEPAISLSTTSVTMTAGDNNSITATVSNADAAKVVWTGAAGYTGATYNLSSLGAGTYTLTASITANGVTKTAQATVVVNTAPTPTPPPATTISITGPAQLEPGATATLTANVSNGSGDTTWECSGGGSLSGSTGGEVTFTAPTLTDEVTSYVCTITAKNNGTGASLTITVAASPAA